MSGKRFFLCSMLLQRFPTSATLLNDDLDSSSCPVNFLQVHSYVQEKEKLEVPLQALTASQDERSGIRQGKSFSITASQDERNGFYHTIPSITLNAVAFAFLGGVSNGCYPAVIKARPVVEANVNPLIFQCYKSMVAFFSAWLFLIPILLHGRSVQFSWWAVASAGFWIPSGVSFIASVQMLGAAWSTIVMMSTNAMFAYTFSVAMLGEKMREYTTADGGTYVLAPEILVGAMIGVASLALTSASSEFDKSFARSNDRSDNVDTPSSEGIEPAFFSYSKLLMGLLLALVGGGSGAGQNLIMLVGRQSSMRANNCTLERGDCPAHVIEEFDVFGSWAFSFGVGSGMMTVVYVLLYLALQKIRGNALPEFHFSLLKFYGCLAGLMVHVGNILMQAAIAMAGNSVITPLFLSVAATTSGVWGVFIFREISGTVRICFWILSALWTVAFAVALTFQKV